MKDKLLGINIELKVISVRQKRNRKGWTVEFRVTTRNPGGMGILRLEEENCADFPFVPGDVLSGRLVEVVSED